MNAASPYRASLPAGRVVARDFRVVRPLDEGSQGTVYVVEQISTGELRALKLIHVELAQDPRNRARFEQEAKIGSRIRSDHVVKVIAAGVDDTSGMPFLVMELLQGSELSQWIERQGRLDVAQLSLIMSQLCHALSAAHASGIVHRDLKPENVFIANSERADVPFTVKLLDFGIAKVVAEIKQWGSTMTVGTPAYMAPEQGNPHGAVTPAADVWALGLIAFRALTGKPFWLASNDDRLGLAELITELMSESIPSASARASELSVGAFIPHGFDGWFARCVNRAPAERFQNAGEAWSALAPILGARPSVHTPLPAATGGATVAAVPLPADFLSQFETSAAGPATEPQRGGGTLVAPAQPMQWQTGGTVIFPHGPTPVAPPTPVARNRGVPAWAFVVGALVIVASAFAVYWQFAGSEHPKKTESDDTVAKTRLNSAAPSAVSARIPSASRPSASVMAPGKLGCAPEADLPYVLTAESQIYSFDPSAKQFKFVAKADCPQQSPNSMAVDRNLVAWINYPGELDTFDLKTKSSCKRFMTLPEGFTRIGMAFSVDAEGATAETLFVDSQAGGGLGKVDPIAHTITPVSQFNGDPNIVGAGGELAGTGTGKLFACFSTQPFRIAEINKANGAILSDKEVGMLQPSSWAYALWRGDYYLFMGNGATTNVLRYRPTDGSTESYVQGAAFAVVGANVSTCGSVPTTAPSP